MGKATEYTRVAVDKLIPYVNNAKQHSASQVTKIASSIREFGFLNPVLIDASYNVIAGHGRILAAKKLQMDEVPCLFVEGLSEAQRKAYILADNRLSELGEWDMELVMGELAELDDLGFDTELTGFEFEVEPEITDNEDDVPEPPTEPKAKLGDLYQLGRHRLICGDSTDVNVVERLMGGKKSTISFTSPPYNVGDNAKLNGTTHMPECKYESGEDDLEDYNELLNSTTKNMIMCSRWVFINLQMLANNKQTLCEWLNNYKDALCDVAIWHKTSAAPAMAERVMNSQFEFIFIFSNENNSRAIGTNNFRGTVSNIYEGSERRKNEFASIHSATFPLEFVGHFIKNFTNENDTVLDVFGGTGSTLIAAEQLNRSCYMCELDPKYIDVIIERWETFTGEKAVLLDEWGRNTERDPARRGRIKKDRKPQAEKRLRQASEAFI